MEKIRNHIIHLLEKGEIPNYEYINYFNKLKNYKFEKNDFLQKNIDVLKNYYPNATEDEKTIINNVIFILEIFNSQKNALNDFLFRTLHFNWKTLHNEEAFQFAIEFFQKQPFALPKDVFIKTIEKILEPNYFFSLDEFKRKAILINILLIWHNENIFMKPFWLKKLPIFKKLIDYAIRNDYIEDAMYSEFFIYHFYGNTAQTIKDWEKFNETIEKPLSKYFKKWGDKKNIPQPKNYRHKKKRLGFLIDRLVLTSPLMVEYSLWKALMEDKKFKNNYEIYVYSMNYAEKQLDDENWIKKLENIGIKFYTPQDKFLEERPYYNHFAKAIDLREQILNDKIDILFSFFGYAIPNFLFSTRTAPKQIFWSHGNCTSEIENIDLRISHFEQECKNHKWKTFNVPMPEEFLIGSPEEKTKGETLKKALLQAFGKDTIILGTIGRLIKIDSDEYLKTIAQIMAKNPNTIYLACGEGNKESIKEKLKKYNIDENRFIFTGMVNPHIYGWVIDIWPDTFPLRQGQSKEEFMAKGGSVIYMDKYLNDTIRNWYKNFKTNLFAKNKEEYIKLTNELIKNKELREKVGNYNKNIFKQKNIKDFIEIIK